MKGLAAVIVCSAILLIIGIKCDIHFRNLVVKVNISDVATATNNFVQNSVKKTYNFVNGIGKNINNGINGVSNGNQTNITSTSSSFFIRSSSFLIVNVVFFALFYLFL